MDLLGEAITALRRREVLDPLEALVRQVYRRAAERHEPELGDDAMSFGTLVWRNLTNLAVAEFADRPGVDARIFGNSLEILCAGYILRLYSLQGGLDSDVESVRWEGSDVRLGGAVENSEGARVAFDEDETLAPVFFGIVPPKRHLRVAHAGDLGTGEAIAYLGFPRDNRDGGSPWFDVTLWFGQPPAQHTVSQVKGARPAETLRHDQLPLPELDIRPRTDRHTGGEAADRNS